MKASEKFRLIRNSPVGYIAKYYSDVYLKDMPNDFVGSFIEEIKTGKTPSKSNTRFYESEDFNWFKPDEIGLSLYIENAREKVSKYAVNSNQVTIFKPNTVLINCIGDIGRVAVLKKESSSNQQITGILFNEKVLPEYAYYYFLSHRDLLEDDASSTTLPIINQKKLLTVPFKRPEIKEQRRIVELLNYCWECIDEGITPSFKRFQFEKDFINQCKIFFEIHSKQNDLQKEFEIQQTRLQQLRQAILQEAVQGKLSKQNKDDEPADKLLQRIKAEKQKLIAAGKLKKEKELPPITEDEIPFELPKGWVWVRGENVASFIDPQPSHRTPPEVSNGFPYVGMSEVRNDGSIDFTNARKVSLEVFKEHQKRYTLEEGDFIFGKIGTIGEPTFLPKPFNYTLSANIILIQVFKKFINPLFVTYYLQSPLAIDLLKEQSTNSTHLVFGIKKSRILLFPLPPLFEQHRIVAKVQQLLQMVNQLDQQIAHSQTQAQQLLQAVLKEAFTNKGKVYEENEVVTMAAEG